MKTYAMYAGGLAVALILTLSGLITSEYRPITVALAQDGTAVPTTAPQATAALQTAQPVERENNGFPWGLLGLVGLAGLAGLRPRPEPVRREAVQGASKVGVYDAPKK